MGGLQVTLFWNNETCYSQFTQPDELRHVWRCNGNSLRESEVLNTIKIIMRRRRVGRCVKWVVYKRHVVCCADIFLGDEIFAD